MDDHDDDSVARNPDRPLSIPLISLPEMDTKKERKAIKRISSPEKWELKQMKAASVISVTEMPDFDEETGILPKEDEGSGEARFRGAVYRSLAYLILLVQYKICSLIFDSGIFTRAIYWFTTREGPLDYFWVFSPV